MVALLLTTLSSGVARAAEVPEAKKHVDLGVAHYEAGRYEEAIKEFELAYRLSHRPAILFNIARAEAKLGHDENAIAFLRRYLEERPNADDAPAVLAEIEAREKAVAAARDKVVADKQKAAAEAEAAEARRKADAAAAEARRAAESARASAEADAQRKSAAERAAAVDRERSERLTAMKRAGYALVAVGPVIAAVGIGLGVAAMRAGDEVASASIGTEWADKYPGLESRGKAFAGAGIALDVIGAAAAGVGIGLLGYAHTRKPSGDRAFLIVPTGRGVTVGGTF